MRDRFLMYCAEQSVGLSPVTFVELYCSTQSQLRIEGKKLSPIQLKKAKILSVEYPGLWALIPIEIIPLLKS